MKFLIGLLLFLSFAQFSNLAAQNAANLYETEILMNPNPGGKDTREVNAVLVFEKDSLKIYSRRKKDKIYKEFRYSDIAFVEHSFSKRPAFEITKASVVMLLLTGIPISPERKEKHWLSISGKDDFAVLKIENDNYRLIKMEFLIRHLDLGNVNEDRL